LKKNDYWNETNNYKYSGSLFTKPLIYFEVGFYKKECKKLKEENKKIKEEFEKLKEEYEEFKKIN
jgi:cell division protein FtsB